MGNLENTAFRQEAKPHGLSLIEGKELYRWQKHFCAMANIFVCCVDGNGTPLTEFSGNEQEKDRLKKIIDNGQFQSMLQRVSESTLEEQAIETTAYPNLRLAVISAKADGKPVVSWLVFGVLSDVTDIEEYEKEPLQGFSSTLTGKQFEAAVDALHDMTRTLLACKVSEENAAEEIRKSKAVEQEMEERLKRAETLTEIMRLLDSTASIERIMKKLLQLTGNYLRMSAGAVYRPASIKKDVCNQGCALAAQSVQAPCSSAACVHPNTGAPLSLNDCVENDMGHKDCCSIDILSSWVRAGITWNPCQEYDPAYAAFFQTKKTLVLSAGSKPKLTERKVLEQLGLTAVVIVPVTVDGAIERYVYFGQAVGEHVWGLEEIKLIKDAAKILQSILSRRTS